MEIRPIARICNDYTEKFGIPRQSGMAKSIESRIVFEKEFRVKEALKGLEGFSYIWLIWDFSESHSKSFNPTVRPPALGGNVREGVFATRSPNRPNSLGLSSVILKDIVLEGADAPYLTVMGADLMNGTPIYDIKPYIKGDCHPDALAGFSKDFDKDRLLVEDPKGLLCVIPEEKREGLKEILSCDPRPSYQDDPERIYGAAYSIYNVKFKVCSGVLQIVEITKTGK